jgi:hypothetical protein
MPDHCERQAGQAEIAAEGGAGQRSAKIADAPSLQLVADHERLSAVRTAGRAADQTSQRRGRKILD